MGILAGSAICVACVFIIYFNVQVAEAGECCRSYVDNSGVYHYQQWCPVFCCGYAILGKLECCTNPRFRAFDGNRDGFCAAWFSYSHNIWAPIIIGLLILAVLIASCVCCIRCCFCI